MTLPLQPATEHVPVHLVVIHDENEPDERLGSGGGRFVQRTNGSRRAGAEVRPGSQTSFPDFGGQRPQKFSVVQKTEQCFGGLMDLLQIGDETGVPFSIGFLLAQLAVADNEVKQRATLALQRIQIQFARLDARGRDTVVDEHEELAASGVHFLQIRNVRVQTQVFRLLLQHFAVANDLVQRRAQVVANIGKSGVVAGIGLFSARLRTGRGCSRGDSFSCF